MKSAGEVFQQERDHAMAEHRAEMQQLELRLIEEVHRKKLFYLCYHLNIFSVKILLLVCDNVFMCTIDIVEYVQ